MKKEFNINPEQVEELSNKCKNFWEILEKTQFKSLDEKQKAWKELGLAPTQSSTIYKENTASLNYYIKSNKKSDINPVLIIPSLINKNYTMDLIEGHSLVEHIVKSGIPVYIIDWGNPGIEHMNYSLDEMIDGTLNRMIKRIFRHSGKKQIHLIGQCIGGVLSTIYSAKYSFKGFISSMVNLTSPIDFSKGGKLTEWTDPETFNLDKIVNSFKEDGAISPKFIHAGFPFLDLNLTFNKYRNLFSLSDNNEFVRLYRALDFWGNDNIPYPCEIFRRFIRDLYQENKLFKGELVIGDKILDLKNIKIPLFNIMAKHDHVFPKEAALQIPKTKNRNDKNKIYEGGHVTILAGLPARFEVFKDIEEFIKKNN